jgi:hypothetical protein
MKAAGLVVTGQPLPLAASVIADKRNHLHRQGSSTLFVKRGKVCHVLLMAKVRGNPLKFLRKL